MMWGKIIFQHSMVWGVLLYAGVLSCAVAWAASLPGGASSLSETYQDWRLTCQMKDNATHCTAIQRVFNDNPRQLILALSLVPDGMRVRGQAVLPFGLDLSRGISLLENGQTVGDVYPFSTCLPEGCIVPLDLDDAQWSSLLKSSRLEVKVNSLNGRTVKFPASTKGLAEAMARARVMMQ